MIKLIKFYGTFCSPCKVIAETINEIKSEYPQVTFNEVDVDTNGSAVLLYKVSAVPTVVIEKNGKEVTRFTGIKPKGYITNLINHHL